MSRKVDLPDLARFTSEPRPAYVGASRTMSKQSKQLANAERVADEAIDSLSRLSKMFREHVDQVDAAYQGSFTYEREVLQMADATVARLRRELEGPL